MKNLMKTAAAFLLGIQVCACSQVENKVSPAIPSDPEIEANIRQWLKKMTLEEKIGQMCEITIDVVTDFEASKKNGFTLSEAKFPMKCVRGRFRSCWRRSRARRRRR